MAVRRHIDASPLEPALDPRIGLATAACGHSDSFRLVPVLDRLNRVIAVDNGPLTLSCVAPRAYVLEPHRHTTPLQYSAHAFAIIARDSRELLERHPAKTLAQFQPARGFDDGDV